MINMMSQVMYNDPVVDDEYNCEDTADESEFDSQHDAKKNSA